MPEIREIPHEGKRVESGPLRIGDDWAGVFIRGDDAGMLAFDIEEALDSPSLHPFAASRLRELVGWLRGSDERVIADRGQLDTTDKTED